MLKSSASILVASLFAQNVVAAEPEQVVWRGSGWTVSLTLSEGRPIGCHSYADNNLGTRLVVALYRSAEWRGAVGDHGNLPNLRSGPVQLIVDDKQVHAGRAVPFPGGGIRLGTLPPRAVSAISQGQILDVVTGTSGSRRLPLTGSADAIAKVEQCVALLFENEQKSRTVSYRVNSNLSDGVLNLRARPSAEATLIAAVPAGTNGLRPMGSCLPSEDPLSSVTWCQFVVGNNRGWLSMLGLTEEPAPNTATPAPKADEVSNGTAFFVSAKGHLLTNAHVVKECRSVSISQPGLTGNTRVTVLARDSVNDLALLAASGVNAPRLPALRRQVRLGEDIALFGYPLTGLIASSGNFTRGSVTALAGIDDDTSKFQMAAPVQPGNSGGPVVDQFGNVVGVVVGKLNALSVAKVTGNIPEQINFAIKASAALGFLEANQVQAADAVVPDKPMAWPDLAEHIKRFTVLVTCIR